MLWRAAVVSKVHQNFVLQGPPPFTHSRENQLKVLYLRAFSSCAAFAVHPIPHNSPVFAAM